MITFNNAKINVNVIYFFFINEEEEIEKPKLVMVNVLRGVLINRREDTKIIWNRPSYKEIKQGACAL